MKYDPNNSNHIKFYIKDLQAKKSLYKSKINEADVKISAMRFKLSQIGGLK